MRAGPGLLAHRDFRQLLFAVSISQVGSQIGLVALPLVAVITLRASALEVGLLAACETAAFLLIGLAAGAWVDRLRRRDVLIVGDLGRAVVLGSVPVAWLAGVLTMPQLYVVGLVAGVLTVFFDVAYQSYLPFLVSKEHLVDGNAKLEVVHSGAQLGGPPLGGVLVQAFTAPFAVAVDALSFLASALFLGFVRRREPVPPKPPRGQLGREVLEGIRFVLGHRLLRAIAMTTGTTNLFSAGFQAMLLLYLARELGLSPGVIGLFMATFGIGALLGALAIKPVVGLLGQGPALVISVLISGLMVFLIPLAQPGWLLWLAGAASVVDGTCIVIYNVTQVSFRQSVTPERLLGRMNATMRFVVWGTMPLGAILGGALGGWLGVREAMWIGCAGMLLAVLPVALSPLRSMRVLEEEPATR
ncbi:MFS transporter [Dactylosporangium roseum]|uniref:MFS transporter n=1 Tax=Dactylosporangium roseum TaxID=47989 RepID=A0ABY5Z5C5_9ACTN|nr:MFS transporter [Dactylosporangium roseum]UWZ36210.1 MFS transporter [Dactylosporangium roseum]